MSLRETGVDDVPLADDLDQASLEQALGASIEYFARLAPGESIQFGSEKTTARTMRQGLEQLRKVVKKEGISPQLFSYIRAHFRPFTSAAPSVLYTGYFEASLKGSRTHSSQYRFPLYKTPADLVTVELDKSLYSNLPADTPGITRGRLVGRVVKVPYSSRTEIERRGILRKRGLELAWVDDQIDLFFLQIQGSGRIQLPNGKTLRVGFADKNGHPYRAIGKYMMEKGYLARGEVTMQSIKRYLRTHPEVIEDVFAFNPSFVFFREATRGPLGNIEVPLTPRRSIATDSSLFPKGALAIIETEKPIYGPDGVPVRWERFSRIVLNQDTGGAIRGAGRVDLFTGFGKDAEELAGRMQQKGELFFLMPIEEASSGRSN